MAAMNNNRTERVLKTEAPAPWWCTPVYRAVCAHEPSISGMARQRQSRKQLLVALLAAGLRHQQEAVEELSAASFTSQPERAQARSSHRTVHRKVHRTPRLNQRRPHVQFSWRCRGELPEPQRHGETDHCNRSKSRLRDASRKQRQAACQGKKHGRGRQPGRREERKSRAPGGALRNSALFQDNSTAADGSWTMGPVYGHDHAGPITQHHGPRVFAPPRGVAFRTATCNNASRTRAPQELQSPLQSAICSGDMQRAKQLLQPSELAQLTSAQLSVALLAASSRKLHKIVAKLLDAQTVQ